MAKKSTEKVVEKKKRGKGAAPKVEKAKPPMDPIDFYSEWEEKLGVLFKELSENLGSAPRFKAASQRSRKTTTNIEKLFKEYRRASVEFDKTRKQEK
jgi:hypothetical protein